MLLDGVDAQDSVFVDMSVNCEELAGICARAQGRLNVADLHDARGRALKDQIDYKA
jgi:hypothetical protein